VFTTTIDEFLGQISILEVVSGTIRADSVAAGDIVAVTKLAATRTGDKLAPDGTPVAVVVPALPRPVYGVAIAAVKPSDEDRLATALHRLVIEDPIRPSRSTTRR
jgi:elongation factor G